MYKKIRVRNQKSEVRENNPGWAGFTRANFAKQNLFGFTLIELLVVIIIIGILMAIGMATYISIQKSARDSKRIQDIRAIQKVLEQYYTANRNYPSFITVQDPVDMLELNSYFESGKAPQDPNPGNLQYKYYSDNQSAGCKKYIVCAVMESCSGGNCNRNVDPPSDLTGSKDGCAAVVFNAPTSGTGRFCAGALSN